jgi:hypothetical protein
VLAEATLFRFFPKIRPNTVLKDDFFRCGVAILALEGTLVVEFLGGLVRLAGLSSDDCAGTDVDSRSSAGVPMGNPGLSIIFSRSGPVEDLNRICSSSPSAPNGTAIPVPGALIGKSSSSIGIGFDIGFPRIEDPVFVRLGASPPHFPEARNLLIVPDEKSTIYF